LAQIIRVNLDAKMAGLHRREGIGSQAPCGDWITAWLAGRRTRGKRIVNSVNSPNVLSTAIVPPC
jgi:hypothetical protein